METLDSMAFDFLFNFDTAENNSLFAKAFYEVEHIPEGHEILTNIYQANPYTEIVFDRDFPQDTCGDLKKVTAKLLSLPLTGVTRMGYRMWLYGNPTMLKDEYKDLMPLEEVKLNVDKTLTEQVEMWMYFKELDKIADNIIGAK